MTLLVYYNQNYNNFYIVYTKRIYIDKKVGQVNGFGHVLVQILVYRNNKLFNVKSFNEIYYISHKETLKSRLAKRAIRWLNKYRE